MPEAYLYHSNHYIRGIYIIVHESVYWFAIRRKYIRIRKLSANEYFGNPDTVRRELTKIDEILDLFSQNIYLLADPLAWKTLSGKIYPEHKFLDLKRHV